MRNFTLQNSLNSPDFKSERNGSLFRAFFAFLSSLLFYFVKNSLSKRLGRLKIFDNIEFLKLKKAFALFVLLFSISKVAISQNAPLGQDKYYMLVGELLANNQSRTDVYPYTTGGGITSCSLPGGGGEGIVVDPTKNIAYIATCCDQGEVIVYDMNLGTFLSPIALPGEDILDVSISDDFAFLYVATYNKFYKISTTSKSVVASFDKSLQKNPVKNDFWGTDVNSSNGRVYFSTNWKKGSGASTIESIANSLTGGSTLIATAPAGFHYRGIVFDASGNLWAVASHDNNTTADVIYKITAGGTVYTYSFPTPLANNVPANGKVDPFDLAFGPDGNLYVTTFAGDCVTKFNVSNSTFSTFLKYTDGVRGKSISFVGGNFKCVCIAPVLNLSNLTQVNATCTSGASNTNATATIGGLVFDTNKPVKGDIKEGSTYGQIPLYNAPSNKTLGSGQTTLSFNGLKPNTVYTIRVWSGTDACYSDLTFTTNKVCCATITNPDPITAEVIPGQEFPLTVESNAPFGTYIEWVRSTQNVTSLAQLTDKTVVGGGFVTNAEVTINVTAPTTIGIYYYYASFKPLDVCSAFVKHTITVKNIGTNDPICFSGSRVLTDNLLNGACGGDTTNYSFWLNMSSSTGKNNYQYFRSSGLKFEEYCDGTAKIFGRVCAINGAASDCIDVVYNLSGRTAITPTYSPKPNSCTTYGNDLYYYTSGLGTITGVSGGIYEGFTATIDDAANNTMPAFQVGSGANVNTNNFGASGWYNVSILNDGINNWSLNRSHGDFNFNLGTQVSFQLEASKSAESICKDGEVTLNAQIKGNVPASCNLAYSWKSPAGTTVSNSQSYIISNIQANQAGVYTVTATFTSGGKTCSADSNC